MFSDLDDFDWILTDSPTPTRNTGPDRAYQGTKEVFHPQMPS